MDWNRISGVSGIGTFLLTAAMLVIMALPLLRDTSSETPDPVPAQENYPVNPWLMPSILAASLLVSGYLHLRAARLQHSSVSKPEKKPMVGAVVPAYSLSSSGAQELNDRIIADIDREGFQKIFRDHMEMQAKQLVGPFIGKWIKMAGKVRNVDDGTPWMSVMLEDGPPERGCTPVLHFDRHVWYGRLSVTQRGTEIHVLGRISDVNGLWIDLRDCELL